MRIRIQRVVARAAALGALLLLSNISGSDAPAAILVEFPAIEDATVDSQAPYANFGGSPELASGWSEDAGDRSQRALLRFELETLPPAAIIESAWLELQPESGTDGPVGRVVGGWSEGTVTWQSQPGYAPPLVEPDSPGRWDVTGLVVAWHMGLLPDDGLALLDTPGTASPATYSSREGAVPPRLVVTYELEVPDDPQPPPGIGPPVFSVDPGLVPFAPELEPILVGGTPYPRPLAVLLAEQGLPFTFIEDEVILTPADGSQLAAFLETFGGTILRSPGLPPPPPELEGRARVVPPPTEYLIKLDPAAMDPSNIDADAAANGMLGDLLVSSEEGLRLIALVLQERLSGLDLSLNFAGQLQQAFPPVELEEQPAGAGFEDPIGDAALYPEMDDAANQRTGVNRAWQYMAFSTRASDVVVAVMDAGFCLASNGTRCTDGAGALHIDLPATFHQYDFNDSDYNASGINPSSCSGGSSCPYHGAGTTSIATAVQDNQYGIAGTGSPVSEPIMFKFAVGLFQAQLAIRTAVAWGADVLSMSWGATCDWACRLGSGISGYGKLKTAMQETQTHGVLTVAAAGNEDVDLHDNFIVPCVLKWTNLCVGALAANSTAKASFSNYGTKSASPIGTGGVRIWAPGVSVRVGPDQSTTGNHDVSGTSIATPFVAGAVALAMGVDPTLTGQQVTGLVLSTRRASADPAVAAGSIDVMRLVMAAGEPLGDALGAHGNVSNAALVTLAGLDDLTLRRGEVDVFRYVADGYYGLVQLTATYVEALGDLRIAPIGGTTLASTQKTTGPDTSTFTATTQDMCPGEEAYVQLHGVNPAVGNGYDFDVFPALQPGLPPDANEPNDTPSDATAITVPRESAQDLFTALVIDCRLGLTLDAYNDVDLYDFTATVGEFDPNYTGVSVQILADFPLTAALTRDGAPVANDTGSSIALEVPNAQPGAYRLQVSGTGLNAYAMRVRIYDPGSRVRGYELEDWLANMLLPDPGDLIPPCGGGCPPLPDWLMGFPFDDATLFALEANGVAPIAGDLFGAPVALGGLPNLFALGTTEIGTLRIALELPGLPLEGAEVAGDGVYVLLMDSDGNEIWRGEAISTTTEFEVELEPYRTYLLSVGGQGIDEALLTIDLPGDVSVPLLPGAGSLVLLTMLALLGARGARSQAAKTAIPAR